MLIFKTTEGIQSCLSGMKKQGMKIGFAPTMGALHDGHLSLLRKTMSENDVCVTSIFVNPAQFNDQKDLDRYPRTFASDLEKLTASGCHVLFFPDVEEMYPPEKDLDVNVDFGFLLKTMEAVFRKGHFEGVAQAVKRLLDIVQPHSLYMGQKDYQQFLVVKRMIEALSLGYRSDRLERTDRCNVNLVMCPTVREPDGLAMSSRNVLLNHEERIEAAEIPKTLFAAKEKFKSAPVAEVIKESIGRLNAYPSLKTEYFEIADAETLEPLEKINGKKGVICVAVKAGEVRLIDNLLID